MDYGDETVEEIVEEEEEDEEDDVDMKVVKTVKRGKPAVEIQVKKGKEPKVKVEQEDKAGAMVMDIPTKAAGATTGGAKGQAHCTSSP